MIATFRHKGLRRLYEDDDRKQLPSASIERIRTILAYLEAASTIDDMNKPSLRLHPLKGKLKGF